MNEHGYFLEFILHVQGVTADLIRDSLCTGADHVEISECQKTSPSATDFKITAQTQDPTVVFDICAQFGRIKSVKIDELKSDTG